ncbi:MAG TPA: DegT/DnrJ/EryC1/StrS family aminotransferase [Candidatus Deferrimicrobiaceae bacterium]
MPEMRIPVADPKAQAEALREGITRAFDRVLDGGHYILGPEVSAFEREFAAFLGAAHCVGVASGTDAVALALRAVGVRPGDEVLTVSHTAVATVSAIEQAGAVPVLADISPGSRCMDPSRLDALVSPRTRAILPVHIYGQPADMGEILSVARSRGLAVVEDCAQAHGAEIAGRKVGTFGDAAAFSFYPTKNLGAIGDGGAVATDSAQVAESVRSLREYGWNDLRLSAVPGCSSRLDELQAAILRVKLPYLADWNSRRREIAARYRDAMAGDRLLPPADVPGTLHAMHLFVVECNDRDALARAMAEVRIGTALHYPVPVHRQPAYAGRLRGGDRLPVTDGLYEKMLTLPMYPELADRQVERICEALARFARR